MGVLPHLAETVHSDFLIVKKFSNPVGSRGIFLQFSLDFMSKSRGLKINKRLTTATFKFLCTVVAAILFIHHCKSYVIILYIVCKFHDLDATNTSLISSFIIFTDDFILKHLYLFFFYTTSNISIAYLYCPFA